MDAVVANFGTNTISIFLSINNNTSVNQPKYPTGSKSCPYSITLSDFNNDKYLDIAVSNYGVNNIGIFLGNGNGTFGSQNVFSTGSSRPLFITTGDFNKDNQSDVAVVHYGTDSIGILLGHGDGTFQVQTKYTTGYDSLPNYLAIGDFNKDNKLDIAVANWATNNIGIFLGYGNGTFANQKIYPTTSDSNPSSIAVGDFDNDNQLDIVVTNYRMGNIGIFLGHGNGRFAPQTTYSIGSKSRPQCIAVGHFDKNHHLDIVILDSENDKIHILPGFGNGSFDTITTYDSIIGSSPIAVAVADFDNDYQSDIAVVNNGTNNLLILSGYSIEPSARETTYFVGRDSRPSAVIIYDFNNDSKLDLAVDNFNDDYILILNGVGDGTFVKGETYSTGNKSTPQYQCIGDLNSDNRMDLITANLGTDCVGVLLGQDNGTFAPVRTYSTGTGSAPWFVAIGDTNNDNHLDIVSANAGSGSVGVLLGYGNGSFSPVKTYPTGVGSTLYALTVGDVNNDNNLDIVASLYVPASVGIFLGYGNGTFGTITTYATASGSTPFVVALADFNRDNHLDIVNSNENSGNIGVFLGNGDGTFKKQVTYSTGAGSVPYFVTVADFNNDDYYDIAATIINVNEVVIFFGDGNGTFELARRYSTGSGSSPYGIAAADLDNDKHLEIVVTYWGTGYVSVLTEYYVAEFANQSTYLTGSAPHPYSIAVNDFNNDGRSDVVVANSGTDNLGILFGLANGTFDTPMKYSIGTDSYPQYVITGDINKDNHIDIVSVNSKNDTISVIMGYGNGTFASQMILSTGVNSHPYAMAMGDFNNDQRVDFVIANQGTDSVGILIGFDYGTFQSSAIYSKENNLRPRAVVVNDFNNDNRLDIAVTFRSSNTLAVLLGYGNGSFTDMISYSTGSDSLPFMLTVNDFNNDTQLDIVVVNSGSNIIGVFLGYGNGSFAIMITYFTGLGSAPQSIDVGDFNNDGLTDIVSINTDNNNIGIFLGYGNGSFATMVTYSTRDYSKPSAAAVGDLNDDGHLDIVVGNHGTSNVGVFIGFGNGSFAIQMIYPTGYQSWPFWVAIEDFNRDNQLDIAVANFNNNNIGILLGYGNGSFTNVATYSSGSGSAPQCLRVGDFNNDNILDIAVAMSGANSFVVLFGFGDGTFLLGTIYSTGIGSGPFSLAIGDFNNDTRLDIVVANYLLNNIGVYLGYGYEPFAGVTEYTTGDGSQPHSVAVGDFNSDNWLDIVVANYGTDTVGILIGYGHGVFNDMITYPTGVGSAPYSVAVADFNNDNQSDIVVTDSETGDVAILLGDGHGTFAIGAVYSTGARSRPYTVSIGDFDNDRRLDIVIANSGTNTILLLYGHGNGTFGNKMSYTLGYEYHPYSVAVTDSNKDNWMEIVIACYGTDNIETLIKMC